MIRLYSRRTYRTIALSKLSPPIRIESATTSPPREMTAMSVVPPPMSTTMLPSGSATLSPAPIAAAMGSEMSYTCFAPACIAASKTARFSTLVTPEGTQTTT